MSRLFEAETRSRQVATWQKNTQQWGKLTDDQLDVIAGKREHLSGRTQEIYGITKDEAEKQISDWQARQKDQPK